MPRREVNFKPNGGETMKRWIAAVLLLFSVSAAFGANTMKAFPPAEDGMVRYVLQLPQHEDESAFKVELIVGQTVQIDAQNRYFFSGRIEAESIAGWGYSRYIVRKIGPMGGTLMAVDPDAPKVMRFITLGGEPYLVGYNSRLPIVIYLPKGTEVRYRLWSAGGEAIALEPG
jgi:ecotin